MCSIKSFPEFWLTDLGRCLSLIYVFQNAFVPNRLISDNILLAHETVEFIRKKRRGQLCFAMKLDMSKAYDRVKWLAVVDVLSALGFSPKWVDFVCQCLSTISFSVLVNGVPSDFFCSSVCFASR